MNKKVGAALAAILIFLFSFIYVTASGISHLSNETALFLYLDETRDPGTVEVASLAVFDNARLKELIKINPLTSTDALKKEGVFLSDSLIKAKSLKEGVKNAKTIAEQQTAITIDRVVLITAPALKSVINAGSPLPIDKKFTVSVLDKSFTLHATGFITGKAAEQCIRGNQYPGIANDELVTLPEDYLWEVKAEIINDVTKKLVDFSAYPVEERNDIAFALLEQYRNDSITVYEKNAVLMLVYYLPESVAKYITSFAVRRIT